MTAAPTVAENRATLRALVNAMKTCDPDQMMTCPVCRCVQERVLPLLHRHADRGPRAVSNVCTIDSCVAARSQVRGMLRLLTPSLQPGGGLVDALTHVVTTAADIKAQRDRANSTIDRVTRLMLDHRRYGSMIDPQVLAMTLGPTAHRGS